MTLHRAPWRRSDSSASCVDGNSKAAAHWGGVRNHRAQRSALHDVNP